MIKTFTRVALGLLPLFLSIVLLKTLSDLWLQRLWEAVVLTTVLFYVACYLWTQKIHSLQSMPYTYLLKNNFGQRSLESQLLTYASYHTKWYNHLTHTAFPLEAIMWMTLIYYYFDTAGLFLSVCFLLLQAASFKDKMLFLTLSSFWFFCALFALTAYAYYPEVASRAAIILLMSCGFWRFTGHWVEPVPPGLIGNKGFIKLSLADAVRPGVLYATLLGFTSEFAAGLPFRLVVPWIYVGLQKHLPSNLFLFNWDLAKKIRYEIHQNGWESHEATKKLVGGG